MGSTSGASTTRTLAGRYRLGHTIGTGATAKVFDAVDLTDNSPVVVKMLPSAFGASKGFMRRFQADVQAAAELSHPNIARVRDFGVERVNDKAYPFVVTDQLAGGSLRGILDRRRLLTPSQALLVGLDVCKGLDYAHRRGLVHGAITPSNLLFGVDRRVRIADFGLSRLMGEVAWADPGRVDVDVARYASPEQAQGLPLEPASDVYSLCLTLIECVTGQVPFAADTTVATLTARVDKLMPVSADLGPLAAVLERAGRPSAADRATAAEFGRALVQNAEKMSRPAPIPVVGIGLFGDVTGSLPRLDTPSTDLTTAVSRPRSAEPERDEPRSDETRPPRDETRPPRDETRPPRGEARPARPAPAAEPGVVDLAPPAVRPIEPVVVAPEPDDPEVTVRIVPRGSAPDDTVRVRPRPPADDAAPPRPSDRPAGRSTAPVTTPTPRPVTPPVPVALDGGEPVGGARPADPTRGPDPSGPRVRPAPTTRVFTPNVPPPVEMPPPVGRLEPSVVRDPTPAIIIRPVVPEAPVAAEPAAEAPATVVAEPPVKVPVLDPGLPTIVPAVPVAERAAPVDAGLPTIVPAEQPPVEESPAELVPVDLMPVDPGLPLIRPADADDTVIDASGAIGAVPADWQHGDPATKRVTATVETVEGDDDALNIDRRSVFAYVLVALGLVIAAATLVIGYRALSTPSYVVPNLIGVSQAEATNRIASNGWEVEVRLQRDDTQAEGDVIRTEPSAGERLDKGAAFVMIVSEGPTLATLPEITGLPIDEARSTLEAAGLSVREADRVFDETVLSGQVVSWSVPAQEGLTAGGQVPKGTTIEVVVSAGPQPRQVPNLIGSTLAEARETLTGLDLALGTVTEQFDEQVPAGQIISSDPAAGTAATRDTAISVVVSKGPDLVAVPNIFGLTKADAEAELAKVDLVVGSVSGPLDGVVRGSDIAPGTRVERGTRITLVFGPA